MRLSISNGYLLLKLPQRRDHFSKNSRFGGFKYFMDEQMNWLDRIFWTSIPAATFLFFTYKLLNDSWTLYLKNPKNFAVDTFHTDWNSTFLTDLDDVE